MVANSDITVNHEKYPEMLFNKTLVTIYNTLKAMKDNDVREIVFISTSVIYGDALGENVTEDFAPLFPISHYGVTKLTSGEGFITSFGENYGTQSGTIRFPNVIREIATHGVIFNFINRLKKDLSKLDILGNGTQFKLYPYLS